MPIPIIGIGGGISIPAGGIAKDRQPGFNLGALAEFPAGCCAFLMTLMVALGLMSIAWIGLLALVVLVQKAAPLGTHSPRVLAAALGAAAVVAWI